MPSGSVLSVNQEFQTCAHEIVFDYFGKLLRIVFIIKVPAEANLPHSFFHYSNCDNRAAITMLKVDRYSFK